MPRFSGKYQDWVPFRDMFTSMVVESKSLSQVEKLHYLKSNVFGDAAKLVASIPVTAENYERTWKKLQDRYENKRVLVNTQLDVLFGLKPVTRKCARELDNLRTTVAEVLEALEALGGAVDQWDFLLVYFVCRKLDSETHEAWELSLGATTEPPTYKDLDNFLANRIRALETLDSRSQQGRARPPSSQPTRQAATHVAVSTPISCPLCSAEHFLSSCSGYQERTPEQRQGILMEKRLCFNCLAPHTARACRSTKRCRACGGKHHTSIHQSRQQSSSAEQNASFPEVQRTSAPAVQAGSGSRGPTGTTSGIAAGPRPNSVLHSATTSAPDNSPVLLATAMIVATSPHGRKQEARALMDQGSELCFVRESLVQDLRLPRQHTSVTLLGIGAQKQLSARGVVFLQFHSWLDPSEVFEVEAHILPKLTACVPSQPIDARRWNHLLDLDLADPSFATPGQVDVLLGAAVYGRLLTGDLVKSTDDAPIAQGTRLGWIVSGPTSGQSLVSEAQAFHCLVDCDLEKLVHEFWAQEVVPKTRSAAQSPEDRFCEEYFQSSHRRDPNGRYVVRLPFRTKPESYGNSRQIAERALESLHRRFQREPELRKMYTEFLEEYESLGHMTRFEGEDERDAFYLPHHGVLRETSSTTKLRVVFNGSREPNTGLSVNECLYAGPKVQTDLTDVLMRWRLWAYVFSADIEKMYRQVLVNENDQKYQQIVWSKEASENPSTYKLETVTYGLTCAPFLAIRTVRQLAEDERARYPLAAEAVRDEMYVDDLLSGADSVAEAQEKASQVEAMLRSGGFILQKWASNQEATLSAIDARRQASANKTFGEDSTMRALGLTWSPSNDSFVFAFREEAIGEGSVTKRSVLSATAKLFDPLGWLAPIVVRAKIFLQSLWKTQLSWDDPIPSGLASQWREFTAELRGNVSFVIPRWLRTFTNSSVEIHGFSDASQEALAAVVYVRVVHENFEGKASILTSKTKVAPLKQTTIARLELSAALMLAQLVAHVVKCLKFQDVPIYLWTDSTVTLAWIKSQPSRWKEYVANRVAAVQELVPEARWQHVPGCENPADVASRGLSPQQLLEYGPWWSGPSWLETPSTTWPMTSPTIPSDANLEERAPVVAALVSVSGQDGAEVWDLIERYSSLDRLLRITARLMQATARFRNRKCEIADVLTPGDLENAKKFWVRTVQTSYFTHEMKLLSAGSSVPRSSDLVRLAPFVDSEGLMRLGGRLQRTRLDYDEMHPIILPRESPLTTLVMRGVHERTMHGGAQLMLSTLRRNWWIVGGRAPVRGFVLRCVRCARHRGALAKQMMGQLPPSRTTPSRPFLNTGVDYAGPFTLKAWHGRTSKTYKGYLIVFVCFCTSAVHLELATDYSTEGFLAAYRRFCGRRGACSTITSDCGSNFIGADAELRRLYDEHSAEFAKLRNLLASERTTWTFNPPSAPHFGGKWEAAVKSTKFHLRRVVGETVLCYEEFNSLLVQIEGVLNSRPLCPLSDDPEDVTALTPAHFLIGGPLTSFPEPMVTNIPSSRLSKWQKNRSMVEHFWQRWSTEYLQRMQVIAKWQKPNFQIAKGSLVLISDDRYPPARWPLARVVELHSGADGLVRVVTLRTSTRDAVKRPIAKLYPLPVATEESL